MIIKVIRVGAFKISTIKVVTSTVTVRGSIIVKIKDNEMTLHQKFS